MDETIPQGGWWNRNWKWFVPVGCLAILATCGCCIGGSILMGATAVSRSRSYQEALTRVKADPDLQNALGTPIEAGRMTQFSSQSYNAEVRTKARVPLHGPKGEGTLYFRAVEHGKELTFYQLDVVVEHKVYHLPGVEPSSGSPFGKDDDVLSFPENAEEARPDVTVEAATDRPGADYRDYEMTDPDASKCALDCAGDAECKAYTFVKPADGKPGRCRLKKRPAAKVASDCCVSGVKK